MEATLPWHGRIACLIVAEAAIFLIFVVAYLFYLGKSLSGPAPGDLLKLPIFTTICLLSSSLTVHFAVAALHRGANRATTLWLVATVLLGSIFLAGTAYEWHQLIYRDGFTIRTNLFGTTFYSLRRPARHARYRWAAPVDARAVLFAPWQPDDSAHTAPRSSLPVLALRRCSLGRRLPRRLRYWQVGPAAREEYRCDLNPRKLKPAQ